MLTGAPTGISPQEGSSLLVLLGTSDHAVLREADTAGIAYRQESRALTGTTEKQAEDGGSDLKTPLEFPEVWRQQENYKVDTVQVKAGRDGGGAQSQIILKMLTPTKFCSSCRGRGRDVCGLCAL